MSDIKTPDTSRKLKGTTIKDTYVINNLNNQ